MGEHHIILQWWNWWKDSSSSSSSLWSSDVVGTPSMEQEEAAWGGTFTTDLMARVFGTSVASAAWGFLLLSSSCSPAPLWAWWPAWHWRMPLYMEGNASPWFCHGKWDGGSSQWWCTISHDDRLVWVGHLEQRQHRTQPKQVAPDHPHQSSPLGVHAAEAVAALLGTAVLLCVAERHQGQDLVSNNTLPIDIIGPHTPEDMEHLIHGIEHNVRAHPSPLLDAGCACLTIKCRHLEICETFIDVPPKMLIVFAKCGIEAPPKDGSKPVKKNQIT